MACIEGGRVLDGKEDAGRAFAVLDRGLSSPPKPPNSRAPRPMVVSIDARCDRE